MSTLNMDSLPKHRMNHFSNALPGNISKRSMYGSQSSNRRVSAPQDAVMHYHYANPTTPSASVDDVTSVAEGFGRMSVQNATQAAAAKTSQNLSTQASDFHGMPFGAAVAMPPQVTNMGTNVHLGRQPLMYNPQVMYPGTYITHPVGHAPGGLAPSPAMFASVAPQYYIHGSYANSHPLGHNNSPLSQGWTSRATSGEMPTLITPPRDSTSSDENDAPGTPFTQYTGYGGYSSGLAFLDRTPHSVYAWSTPSSSQPIYAMPKTQVQPQPIDQEILRLIRQAPAIPPAVPSTSSLKSLDRCLENPQGITNVYIRGLQPDTTDEMLYNMASRCGEIASSKSIIDHGTGLCKGHDKSDSILTVSELMCPRFGFVKYHNYADAALCIRVFHAMGYETSFARESFYSQLKKLSDESNTNLYVSNLPKEMIEHELGAIFAPFKVCSSRILRDGNGNGRGVGFARFETRDVCEEVIKKYNNFAINKGKENEHLIQIRYADTQEQKHLKQQTTQARDFRSQEYEAQTSGRPISVTSFHTLPAPMSATEHDFETYMATTTMSKPSSNLVYDPENFGRFGREQINVTTSNLNPSTSPATAHVNLPTTVNLEVAEIATPVSQDDETESEDHEHASDSTD